MNKDIKVLTYNVAWEAMVGVPEGSAKELGRLCGTRENQRQNNSGKSISQCVLNVAKVIDDTCDLGVDEVCDFVGLQESANWQYIMKYSSVLMTMNGYVNYSEFVQPRHKNGFNVECTLFYNSQKYQATHLQIGLFDDVTGRPCQVVYFTNKFDGTKLIVINVHNQHTMSIERVNRTLSNTLSSEMISIDSQHYNHQYIGPSSRPKETYRSASAYVPPHRREGYEQRWGGGRQMGGFDLTNYLSVLGTVTPSIIMCGDFNDHARGNFYRGVSPFDNRFGSELSRVIISSHGEMPPYSCCGAPHSGGLRYRQGEDKYYSDYVLISQNMKFIQANQVPLNFDYDGTQFPTSDHLPVTAIVGLNSSNMDMVSEISNVDFVSNSGVIASNGSNRNNGSGNGSENNMNSGMTNNEMVRAIHSMRIHGGRKRKPKQKTSKSKLKLKLKTKKRKISKKNRK